MQGKKTGLILAMILCGSVLFSGCSVSSTLRGMAGKASQKVSETTATSEMKSNELQESAKTIDESLEAPAFPTDLSGSAAVTVGTRFQLTCPASVSDGGTVTYQWYRNNVNSNGGGTPIDGATGQTVTVKADEAGTVYFYVVATNNHGNSVNMSVSSVKEIVMWAAGEWKQDSSGYRYMEEDGTYPTKTTLQVGETLFTVDDNGYRTDEGQAVQYVDDPTDTTEETTADTSETDSASGTSAGGAAATPTPTVAPSPSVTAAAGQ